LAAFLTRKDIYAALIIVFVGLSSFFLGAMWQRDRNRPDISIQSDGGAGGTSIPTSAVGTPTSSVGAGAYIGSYTSKIYRLATCPGVNVINPDNKVYFATKESAEAAGYVAARTAKCNNLTISDNVSVVLTNKTIYARIVVNRINSGLYFSRAMVLKDAS